MGDAGRTRPVVQPSKPAHLTAAPVLRQAAGHNQDGRGGVTVHTIYLNGLGF